MNRIRIHEFATGKNTTVTDGLAHADNPVFAGSDYLYFTASINAGPSQVGLDMSSQERPVRDGIYALVLAADGKSPMAPRTGDEDDKKDEKKDEKKDAPKDGDKDKKPADKDGEKRRCQGRLPKPTIRRTAAKSSRTAKPGDAAKPSCNCRQQRPRNRCASISMGSRNAWSRCRWPNATTIRSRSPAMATCSISNAANRV